MKFWAWIGKAASGARGEPSTSRVGFLAFVVAGFLWLTFDLVYGLTSLKANGIDSDWVLAFGVYASAATGGYVGGKVASRPPTPPQQDANG